MWTLTSRLIDAMAPPLFKRIDSVYFPKLVIRRRAHQRAGWKDSCKNFRSVWLWQRRGAEQERDDRVFEVCQQTGRKKTKKWARAVNRCLTAVGKIRSQGEETVGPKKWILEVHQRPNSIICLIFDAVLIEPGNIKTNFWRVYHWLY